MKSSLKILAVLIVFTTTSNVIYAQTFAVKGGLNFSNLRREVNDVNSSNSFGLKPGFHLGASVDFPLSKRFSLESGLLLISKGTTISEEGEFFGESYKIEGNINLLYLDVPLTSKVKFDVGRVKLYGLFGPYLGVGLTGRLKAESITAGETESTDTPIEWGSEIDESQFRRLDYGLMLGTGVEINHIQITASYTLGLANISPTNPAGIKYNNRIFGLSLGYKF